jgi:hypothetical protein
VTRPRTDNYADELEMVVTALVAGDRASAADLIAPLAQPPRTVPVRAEASESVVALVYRRDGFRCRYCGCRVIPTQIMRLIAELFPDDFPYHRNWKAGQTHPAIASRSPSLDHIIPWARGGTNDPENLACACWICNQIKGDLTIDQLGWALRDVPTADQRDWDGLTRFYRPLWELAGRPTNADHRLWLRLLDPAPGSTKPTG